MLGNLIWYRKWRGGKWGRVTGWLWGKRWVKLSREAVGFEEWWYNYKEMREQAARKAEESRRVR